MAADRLQLAPAPRPRGSQPRTDATIKPCVALGLHGFASISKASRCCGQDDANSGMLRHPIRLDRGSKHGCIIWAMSISVWSANPGMQPASTFAKDPQPFPRMPRPKQDMAWKWMCQRLQAWTVDFCVLLVPMGSAVALPGDSGCARSRQGARRGTRC